MAIQKVAFKKPIEEQQTEEQVEEVQEVETKKAVKQSEYVLVQVPTGQQLAYQAPDGQVLTIEGLLVQMANDISKIKKGVLG